MQHHKLQDGRSAFLGGVEAADSRQPTRRREGGRQTERLRVRRLVTDGGRLRPLPTAALRLHVRGVRSGRRSAARAGFLWYDACVFVRFVGQRNVWRAGMLRSVRTVRVPWRHDQCRFGGEATESHGTTPLCIQPHVVHVQLVNALTKVIISKHFENFKKGKKAVKNRAGDNECKQNSCVVSACLYCHPR